MLRKLVKSFNGIKQYRFKLPLIYLLLILLGLLTLIIPGFNECNASGLFMVCFSLSFIILVWLGMPGLIYIDKLKSIIPVQYYSWRSHSENLPVAIALNYIITLLLVYILGLIIDSIQKRKKPSLKRK